MAKDERGFTMIELLIVIAVLGIIAAIVVLAVTDLSADTARVSCRGDARTIESALEVQRGQAPNPALNSKGYATDISGLVPGYVRSLPTSTHYKVALGSNTAIGNVNPAPGASGAIADFNAGTVIISAGPDLGPLLYRDMNDTVTDPCSLAQ